MKPPAVCWAWSRSNPVFSLNFRAAGAPEGQAVRRTASAAKPPASAEPKRPLGAPPPAGALSPANCKLAISRCFFPVQRPGPVLPAPPASTFPSPLPGREPGRLPCPKFAQKAGTGPQGGSAEGRTRRSATVEAAPWGRLALRAACRFPSHFPIKSLPEKRNPREPKSQSFPHRRPHAGTVPGQPPPQF